MPNFSEGYCTDDNARALILAVLLDELGEEPERAAARWPPRTRPSLNYAFDRKTGRFHNFMSFDRRWLDERLGGLPRPRALGAGHVRGPVPHRSFQMHGRRNFSQRALPVGRRISPRRARGRSPSSASMNIFAASAATGCATNPRHAHAATDGSVTTDRRQDWQWFEGALLTTTPNFPTR